MLQSYEDITNLMTRMVRQAHYFHFLSADEGSAGAHPDCKSFSYDVLGRRDRMSPDSLRCCSCVAQPGWWDENGVPRFAPHHPTLCPDIYATEVALLLIACQACRRPFRVQMSWSMSAALMGRARVTSAIERATGIALDLKTLPDLAGASLASQVQGGIVHYGDPPHHDCATGVTMNCYDVRVLEFWSRNKPVTGSHDWQRVPGLEAQLPGADDLEGQPIP